MEELKEILIGNVSNNIKNEAVQFVGTDLTRIALLWEWLKNAMDPLKWRACWIFEHICLNQPKVLSKYINEIAILYPNLTHIPSRRMMGHILAEATIPEKFESKILNAAFEWLQDHNQPIAVRVHAMQIAYNLSKKYPELQQELKITILHLYDSGSAGFKSRSKKILVKIA